MAFLQRFGSRRSISIICGLVVIALVVFVVHRLDAPSQPRNSGPPPAVPVTAAIALHQDVPEIINAIGTVQSIDSVAVQPRVTGAITKIEFTPGQDVRAGQELFLIDPRPYQAALDQAQAQLAHDEGVLEEAQLDLNRYQTLEKQKSIAGQQAQDQVFVVQQDKGTVALDQANVEAARLNLEFCHIAAPISGRAGTLQGQLGNIVGPSSGAQTGGTVSSSGQTATSSAGSSAVGSASNALVTIEQTQPIYVNFSIPQTALLDVKQNQAKASLEVRAYSQAGKLLEKGKLAVIDNQVNTATGTVTMQASFANKAETMWPGEYVSVELIVGIRHDVVTVPAPAVMVGPSGDYVYVIGTDDKVARVNVQQTARQGGVAVIGKGVSAGQKVVSAGQVRLDDGTKVAVQQTTVPTAQGETAAADQIQ